jgi:hypothetical protein
VLGLSVVDVNFGQAGVDGDGNPVIGFVMTDNDYLRTVAGLVTENSLLDRKNEDCSLSNPLTNGECGPIQEVSSSSSGLSVAGCSAIFMNELEQFDLDLIGGDNAAAVCLDLGEGLPHQCATIEQDYYYECLNEFAVKSSAGGLLGAKWFPDTGILGSGSVDAEGEPRVVGQLGDEGSELTYTEFSMYSFNTVDNEDYVKLIEQVREECKNSPIPSYPKGTGFLYWEQYIGLQETLLTNIIFALVAVFCTTVVMLLVVPKVEREKCGTLVAAAFGGAFTLVFILSLYMVEIYGFMGWMDIKLSALPAVSLIMAVGVGVEFTAHIILAFILAEGDRNDRMEASLDHMFVPTIDGTISTFLGIVMLAFSPFEFIVKYYFLVYLIIVILGCLNGLVLLPAILATCGPPSISLPPAGGAELGYRRGSITSPKPTKNPALELKTQTRGSDFV